MCLGNPRGDARSPDSHKSVDLVGVDEFEDALRSGLRMTISVASSSVASRWCIQPHEWNRGAAIRVVPRIFTGKASEPLPPRRGGQTNGQRRGTDRWLCPRSG